MKPANDNLRADIRFTVEPRLVPMRKAARRLHLTTAEFKSHLPAFRRDGFPAACSITGHFDLKAIDAWLDKRAGVADAGRRDADAAKAKFMEAMKQIG